MCFWCDASESWGVRDSGWGNSARQSRLANDYVSAPRPDRHRCVTSLNWRAEAARIGVRVDGVKSRIFAAAAAGLLVLTGCTTTVGGVAKPADNDGPLKPKPMATSAVASLLLSPSEVASAVGLSATLYQRGEATEMTDSTGLDNRDCRSSWAPLEEGTFGGTGWLQAFGQIVSDAPDRATKATMQFTQAAVSFKDSDAADAMLAGAAKKWNSCSDKTILYTSSDGRQARWTNGSVTDDDGVLSMTQTVEGGGGWGCSRMLGVKNNIALDLLYCTTGPGSEAKELYDELAESITLTY
ncbi:sensor domain-containing protein [Mycolicibacterium brumae]|uniref:Sensor domain-containing protein n=1 Tax=Mycolicibacterium brumae TaxID=85968 RepID=A0A2G5PFX5_9MYCO|nr:sensor domain-containing protein [Mycolicibacterium brumae]